MAIRPLAATPRSHVQTTFEDPAYEKLKAKVANVTRHMINDLKTKIPIQDKFIEQFICPITLEVFKEPVMDEHGHTFEKTAIEKNLLISPNCPLNRQPINTLTPNRVVQEVIENWQKQDPIPTFSLFKKSLPELAKKNLAMVQDYIHAEEYGEAISCYAKALQYTCRWKDYQKLPFLFEKNQQKNHALLSYLYLLEYQLQDQKKTEALDTLLQCITMCPTDYSFYNSLFDLYGMISSEDIFHSNVSNGVYASHLLEGHTGRVGLIISDNGILYSCSSDNTIKIWDLNAKPPICTATLEGHTERVDSLAIANGKLYSGSMDTTIKIWDLNTNPPPCIATLTGHTRGVVSLAVADGILFSSSFDNTIRNWDLNTKPPHCTAILHGQVVNRSLIVANGKIFSYSNNEINMWDYPTSPGRFCP